MNRFDQGYSLYDADKDFVLVSIMPAGSLPFVARPRRQAPRHSPNFGAYAKKARRATLAPMAQEASYAHMAVAE